MHIKKIGFSSFLSIGSYDRRVNGGGGRPVVNIVSAVNVIFVILYCIVLYCIDVYCIILYCVVLYDFSYRLST